MRKGGKKKRTRRPARTTPDEAAIVRRLTAPTPPGEWYSDRADHVPVDEARPRRLWRTRTAPDHAGGVVALSSRSPTAFQVACRCGWRTRAFVSPPAAFIFGQRNGHRNFQLNDPAVEESARIIWREHAGQADAELALGLEPAHEYRMVLAGAADDVDDDDGDTLV